MIARVEFNELGKYYLSPHLSNINQVMGNVGIKFKEFVYIYNFACFQLIRMDIQTKYIGGKIPLIHATKKCQLAIKTSRIS